MAMLTCPDCNNKVSKTAETCPSCGREIMWFDTPKDYSKISKFLSKRKALTIESSAQRTVKWFVIINAAIILSASLMMGGPNGNVTILLLLAGAAFPAFCLYRSKYLAIKAHNIRIISKDSELDSEKKLFEIVELLSKRAGLEKAPDVGIFESKEMNAFATGASQNDSLVAFSDSLVKKMDEVAISAVAAHEIAHIANGDMAIMTIIQSAINAIILSVTLPLTYFQIAGAFSSEKGSLAVTIMLAVIKFVVVTVMLFIGNLIAKYFSRQREYAADKLAAEMLTNKSMIRALKYLKNDYSNIDYSESVKSYASMKISSPIHSFDEFFSTHPSLENRITALENMDTDTNPTSTKSTETLQTK